MTYQVDPNESPEKNGEKIRQLYDNDNPALLPQATIECTGAESSIRTAIFATGIRGSIIVIGVGGADINISGGFLMLKEINLMFSNRYWDTWPAAIAAMSNGNLNLDKMVTHQFTLEQAKEAIETFADTTSGSIKIHIVDE